MDEHYLGMISGTSTDGVDAALVSFADDHCRVVCAATTPYPSEIHRRINAIIDKGDISLTELGGLDSALGEFFADCALSLLRDADVASSEVVAIGHHGQTVYHKPIRPEPFTLQIADPNIVAARTGICTVADFRRLDVAHHGQGAPLVPAFHDWLWRDDSEARVVLNIGGIANLTILVPGHATIGFDTGPGNTLLDAWIRSKAGRRFDDSGEWAAGGAVIEHLIDGLLDDPFFGVAPPKSTGRELFNLRWLEDKLARYAPTATPRDVQATLAELTARSIAAAIDAHVSVCRKIIVCGGGAYNEDLLARLANRCGAVIVKSDHYGVSVDWVEAAAFAWLARTRLRGLASNLPSVTGAQEQASLGGVYSGTVNRHFDTKPSERVRGSKADSDTDEAILQS